MPPHDTSPRQSGPPAADPRPSSAGPALAVRGLTVRFGEHLAVDGLDLEAWPGRVTGLLGPNGAGKSTTLGCLAGLRKPDAGSVELQGRPALEAEARRCLGYVPQELALYEDLSGRANVEFFAGLVGVPRRERRAASDRVLERVGLLDRAGDAVKSYSGGMKRRLNFACGVVHRPAVLLLDEPTAGVDPHSRLRLFDLVREERERGTCVIYTTHYMEEAESLCDALTIVDHGRAIASGTLESLRSQVGERDVLRLEGSFGAGPLTWPEGVEVLGQEDDLVTLSMVDAGTRLSEIFSGLERQGAGVRSTTLKSASLESLFLALTGRELRG